MGNKKKATKNIDAFRDGDTSFGNGTEVARGGPPGPALPGTRWVRGKDGWMLHETRDPDRYKA
tara:strand:+ start:451 stop:639 length:189 start_codon:yes stop_codon:yes gene_type:complete